MVSEPKGQKQLWDLLMHDCDDEEHKEEEVAESEVLVFVLAHEVE